MTNSTENRSTAGFRGVTQLQPRTVDTARTAANGVSGTILPFSSAAVATPTGQTAAGFMELNNQAALTEALLRVPEPASAGPGSDEKRLLGLILEALADDRFEAHFQTQHCLQTGAVVGVEALLRLADDEGRFVNTQKLIDVAEANDLIGLIGRQMMHHACRGFARLQRAGAVSGRLALNVSLLELRHPGYSQALLTAVASNGLRPQDIELELTESQPLDLPGVHLDQLLELHAAGVDLAVDDFGSGYASWASLARLPVSSVKLDRATVTPVLSCPRTAALIGQMVGCGEAMHFRVIAEGVQSTAQAAKLVELGCLTGQGFSLSVPATVDALLS